MITLLINLLIIMLIFGVVAYCIRLIPLPAPFGQIALIIIALVFLLVLLNVLLGVGGHVGLPLLR